jgi:hypothetical protein
MFVDVDVSREKRKFLNESKRRSSRKNYFLNSRERSRTHHHSCRASEEKSVVVTPKNNLLVCMPFDVSVSNKRCSECTHGYMFEREGVLLCPGFSVNTPERKLYTKR